MTYFVLRFCSAISHHVMEIRPPTYAITCGVYHTRYREDMFFPISIREEIRVFLIKLAISNIPMAILFNYSTFNFIIALLIDHLILFLRLILRINLVLPELKVH
jgi:hypothetical protein